MNKSIKSNRPIALWMALMGIVFVISCDGNPWGGSEDEKPYQYFGIDKLTVEPDTALMGVDTVTVSVSMRFIWNPFTKEDFDESVLIYEWSGNFMVEEDKGKTNLKVMRFFIPNDTTEYLPVNIDFVVTNLMVRDTTTGLRSGSSKHIRLKRE